MQVFLYDCSSVAENFHIINDVICQKRKFVFMKFICQFIAI